MSGCIPCGSNDGTCVPYYPVLPPCPCDASASTREEGPPGLQGETGATPAFVIGTVTEGSVGATLVENTPTDYTLNLVIPQPPINEANTWTAQQTFEQQTIFQQGFTTTGGVTTIGGTSFEVVPNADFKGNLTVEGNETVAGGVQVNGSTNITGALEVASGTTLEGTEIDGTLSFGPASVVSLPNLVGFAKGKVVLDSCGRPALVLNRGSTFYLKQNATNPVSIANGVSGAICDPVGTTIPTNACFLNWAPVIDVEARISYNCAFVPTGVLTYNLYKGSVGGILLDSGTVGLATFSFGEAGTLILKGRTSFSIGLNNIFVELVNACNHPIGHSQVTIWLTND